MRLIRTGERNAFELLYDRYFDKLVWFARGFVNDTQKAEDIVQEVFVKIIEKPEQFDETKKFSTWVYTLTGTACRNQIRNEQTRFRLLEENPIPYYDQNVTAHHDTDQKILQQRIKTVYEGLNKKEKNIFTLRFEQEFSIREISEIAGIPEGSVKSGIYYMLKKFAHHLKDFAHGK
jgi:RNA polymerase sigma-70 factor (ECF subfamily)